MTFASAMVQAESEGMEGCGWDCTNEVRKKIENIEYTQESLQKRIKTLEDRGLLKKTNIFVFGLGNSFQDILKRRDVMSSSCMYEAWKPSKNGNKR